LDVPVIVELKIKMSEKTFQLILTNGMQIVKTFGRFDNTDLFAIFWIPKPTETGDYDRTILNC
jgi:hypothetical protein